ncbi:hypothetical protein PHLCEN_2v13499 [Hermanssonia centrifuga]|uniref:Aminoglycoside phosphotransferase domain-containing protein n=1 Tax=Hermanssonia centrifuga TaxID=98765 RepID=A0A2R6NEC7_9APHY|nr:hypothetical protein PHLCEN_2v13499 [Hermanssonia centrifuga]
MGKLRVAWTLRSYIRQLRKATSTLSSIPGPLGGEPQVCVGFVFEGKREVSFPNLQSLSDWFHAHVRAVPARTNRPPTTYDPFHDCQQLIFTHMDLNLRDIMIGKDGLIWIIDCGCAGFYPKWFEYMSTYYAECWDGPASWIHCIPFITDPYIERVRWIQAAVIISDDRQYGRDGKDVA